MIQSIPLVLHVGVWLLTGKLLEFTDFIYHAEHLKM